MAVYQSGTMPVIRKRQAKQQVFSGEGALSDRKVKRMLMKKFGIPRKARWHLHINESTNTSTHEFFWYEVETNA